MDEEKAEECLEAVEAEGTKAHVPIKGRDKAEGEVVAGETDNFNIKVRCICSYLQLDTKSLAREFDVAVSTAERWISGEGRPQKEMQQIVLSKLEKMKWEKIKKDLNL